MSVTDLSDARLQTAMDNRSIIEAAVDASPDRIAIVAVRGAYDSTGIHATDFDPTGYDHLATAYLNKSGTYELLEMVPSNKLAGVGKTLFDKIIVNLDPGSEVWLTDKLKFLGSENAPGTIDRLVSTYSDVSAVPVVLPEGTATKFLDNLKAATAPGKTYSFLNAEGQTCTSVIPVALFTADPALDGATKYFAENVPSLKQTLDAITELLNFKIDLNEISANIAFEADLITANAALPSTVLNIFDNFFAAALQVEEATVVYGVPHLGLEDFGTSESWTSENLVPRLLGDVNGDGRADMVGFGSAGTFTAFGQADGTFAAPITGSDTFGSSAAAGGWVSQDQTPRVLGDVNGDGRADIVGFGFAGTFTALGEADGTFAAPITASDTLGSSAAAGNWVSQDQAPRVVGDVNGDGRADIVGFGFAGTFTALGKADGTFAAPIAASNNFGTGEAAGGWSSQDQSPRLLGDVNGDGRADIVAFGFSGAYTALGQADGSFGPATLASTAFGSSAAAGGWVTQDETLRVLGDVDGDGRADIVGFGFAGTFVAFGQPDGTFGAPAFETANFGSSAAAGGSTSQETYPRFAADVSGDHFADLVGFGVSGVFVAQASLV